MKYKKLRDSARSQQCVLNIAEICNYNEETTVLAHVDSEEKGMSRKSPDWFAVFSCSDCHAHLDQHRMSEEDRLFYTQRGLLRTWKFWIDAGLIEIK